ncbi:MAG: hypothetical protein ACNA7K_02170 [Acholeplasmataceae bacterium]
MNYINALGKTISSHYKRYRTLSRRLDRMVSMKSVLKSTLFSILISSLLMLVPTLVIINLFIYSKLMIFLSILLGVIAVGFIMSYYHFYYVLIQTYHDKVKQLNIRLLKWTETSIVSAIMVIITAILLIALF